MNINDQRDILSEPWYFGLTNHPILKIITFIDFTLFLIGAALFIRNIVMASDVPSFLVIDFLQLLASCFQSLLGFMTIRKWLMNYSRRFLRHYVQMKIVFLIFFGTENAVYVPLVCRDPEFEEENDFICNYMDIGPAVLIVWFLFQGILLAFLRQISYKNNQAQQRRIILENIYQNPVSTETSQNEPKALVVEFTGIPFSLINSGPLPFKITETISLKKKTSKNAQRKNKNEFEQMDIRYLIISKNQSEGDTRNKQSNPQASVDCQVENSYKPAKSRRFGDITEIKNIKEMYNVDQIEDRTKVMNFTSDILTRNK